MNPIRITFKTPDALDVLQDDFPTNDENGNKLDEEALDEVRAKLYEVKLQLAKWIQYGELVTIEFDLDRGTATVLSAR